MKSKICFLESKKKNCKIKNKYKYKNLDDNYNKNSKILSCEYCGISFATNINSKILNNFYTSIYTDNYFKNTLNIIKKNIFFEYNRRFFSQVIFFLQSERLFKNIKVLEIGPNIQGILPTLKLFQDKIIYYYIDQSNSEIIDSSGGIKISEYFDSKFTKIPKVDLIWMSHSMEHLCPSDFASTFRLLHKSLNKNGKIFIEIPNDIEDKRFNFPHTLFFTEKFFKIFFKKNNFTIKVFHKSNIINNKINSNHLGWSDKYLKKINTNLLKSENFIKKLIFNYAKFFFKKFLIFYCLLSKQYPNTSDDTEQVSIMRLIIQKNDNDSKANYK